MLFTTKWIFFSTLYVHIFADCRQQLDEYQTAVKNGSYWAVQMLDASAKLPSGLLSGNVVSLGSFDQCLSVQSNSSVSIKGKYCFGSIRMHVEPTMEETTVSWGLCVPDKCLGEEVQVDPSMFLNSNVTSSFHENSCQTLDNYDVHLTPAAIVTISFLSFLFVLILISTIYEIVSKHVKRPIIDIFTAFSIVRNTKLLLATTNSKVQITCLDGIRVISMMWVVLIHEFSIYNDGPNVNNKAWLSTPFYILSATFATDTFFVLSGLLVGYSYQNSIAKKRPFRLIHFYLHRIFRIVPSFAMVVLVTATLLQYFGSGPYWPSLLSTIQQPCQQYWWSAILLVQNYVNVQNMFISPAILFLCNKKRTFAFAFAGILMFLSTAASIAVAWIFDLDTNRKTEAYLILYFMKTHTRAAPWLIGLILGVQMNSIRTSLDKLRKSSVITLWITALITLLLVCLTTVKIDSNYNKLRNVAFVTLSRPLWALAVSWIIIACDGGYGGVINTFLSSKIFQILSKLSYGVYLLHYPMMCVFVYKSKTVYEFSLFAMFHRFWGDLLIALFFSFILLITVGYPILFIETKILK